MRCLSVCLSWIWSFRRFYLFIFFFVGLGRISSSKGPRMGRQFFKNVDFFVTYPLKGV